MNSNISQLDGQVQSRALKNRKDLWYIVPEPETLGKGDETGSWLPLALAAARSSPQLARLFREQNLTALIEILEAEVWGGAA